MPLGWSGLGSFATEVSEVGAFTVTVTLDAASTQGVVTVSDAPGTCPFENLPP